MEGEPAMFRLSKPWLPIIGLLLVLTMMSCGQKTESTSSTATEPTSTMSEAPPPGGSPVSVVAVDLGRSVDAEKLVVERVDVFKPNDTIYASIRTSGTAPNTRVGVKWTYQDGQVVDESEQTITPNGSTNTEFHITKPDGLPAGNYRVEVFVDGSPVQTKDFKVTAG